MNEERKAAIAIFLSIIVIFVYTNVFMAPQVVVEQAPTTTTQQQNVSSSSKPAVVLNNSTTPSSSPSSSLEVVTDNIVVKNPTHEDYLASKIITVITNVAEIKISSLGGRLLSYKLKEYKENVSDDTHLEMVKSSGMHLPLGVFLSGLNDSSVTYSIEGVSSSVKHSANTFYLAPGQEFSLNLKGMLANGIAINKKFKFNAESYLFDFDVLSSAASPDGSSIEVEWAEDQPSDYESNRYNLKSFVSLDTKDSVEREDVAGVEEALPEMLVKWTSLGDNYFTSAIISPKLSTAVKISSTQKENGDKYLSVKAKGESQIANFKIYVGPKEQNALGAAGFDLMKTIDLGWCALFGRPLLGAINFCYSIFGNYGLAIIFVTLLIKLFLLPLTKKSFISMKAMQDIQPEMKALRERVKDPAQVQQEMLAMYKRKGVNPMGGCLPMFLQIPVFLGMYNALQSSIYLRHADFALWINDLSAPEHLEILGIPVPVMVLLMGGSMFLQTLTTPTSADPNQKKIMYMMPIMFTIMFVIFPFPSGLVLYWLVNNTITFIQQYALRTERNIHPYRATFAAGAIVFAIGYVVTLL